jgi:putative alpha-1,2-mannosidase
MIEDRIYQPGPAGWLGDEDTGQMSSWYIFSALGFYPVNPGQPVYALGSPLFDRATIHLENGKSFTVEGIRRTAGDRSAWINHAEIVSGGVLRFNMGPRPNEKWGVSGLPLPGK